MKASTKLRIIGATIGISGMLVLAAKTDWQVLAGVFLLLWGNNICVRTINGEASRE